MEISRNSHFLEKLKYQRILFLVYFLEEPDIEDTHFRDFNKEDMGFKLYVFG